MDREAISVPNRNTTLATMKLHELVREFQAMKHSGKKLSEHEIWILTLNPYVIRVSVTASVLSILVCQEGTTTWLSIEIDDSELYPHTPLVFHQTQCWNLEVLYGDGTSEIIYFRDAAMREVMKGMLFSLQAQEVWSFVEAYQYLVSIGVTRILKGGNL